MVRGQRFTLKHKIWQRWMLGLCFMGLGGLPISLTPTPAVGAEKLYLLAGPLKLSLSVDSLAEFAETGTINRELRFYARFAGDEAMTQLRTALQRRFKLSPVVVSRLTYSPLGEEVLRQLGDLILTEAQINSFYALRSSWILSATNPDGFTLIDLMRRFPTKGILFDVERLLSVQKLLSALSDYTDTTVTAIAQAADAAAAVPINVTNLPDPRLPGPFQVTSQRLQLERKTLTLEGEPSDRKFYVDLYLPVGKPQPAPVVIISHGLGSSPAGFAYLGTHLASHGFVAVLPEHIGSSKQQVQDLVQGLTNSNVTLTEFIERPLDIKQTLNELERLSQTDLAGKLNLQKVGILGHSFGGYTALVTAGATFNRTRLSQQCPTALRFNFSIALQCLNEELPNFDVSILNDSRIKAAIAMNPLTSLVFGPEGMGTLQVPTMMMGGSRDIVTPLVLEQVHPFLWLKTPEKYLVDIQLAGHTALDASTEEATKKEPDPIGPLLAGEDPLLAQEYAKALSVAFMQVYVGDRPEYRAYLTAAYARSITQSPLQLDLVNSLTPEQLQRAYGARPPVSVFSNVTPAAGQ